MRVTGRAGEEGSSKGGGKDGGEKEEDVSHDDADAATAG